MSTTTPGSRKTSSATDTATSGGKPNTQHWLLIVLVFVAGAVSLAVELSASRLLAPYFGTSLFVWANLIGLVLLYLTVGYYLGGRLADRYPRPIVLYGLTAVASLLVGLIPVISRPILSWSLTSFASYSVSVFYGSLVSVLLLFAIPMILLGCVSPFAIRLSVEQVGKAGRTAGQLYAISTAGSILGTFLPVLVLIPNIGTYRTFLVFATALLLVSIIGLVATRTPSSTTPNAPKGKLNTKRELFSLLLLLPLALSLIGLQGPIKPPSGTNGGGILLAERESAYNYIQVVKAGNETQLILNEGLGVHSIYNPNQILTYGPWDYFLIAPYFNKPPFTMNQLRNAAIIGLGGGTIPRELSAVYGNIPIDGVEIDGEIVKLGRQYFRMNEPNLRTIVQDGRYFLSTTSQQYDLIGIDAYQQPYVPFQLTTTEFFRGVKQRLSPSGVVVANAGRTSSDFRLVEALAQTMHTVFPSVYIINTERFSNSVIIGTNTPTTLDNFFTNTEQLTNPFLQSIARASMLYGNMRTEQKAIPYFTDDKAPVEQLIDQIIFDAVLNNKE